MSNEIPSFLRRLWNRFGDWYENTALKDILQKVWEKKTVAAESRLSKAIQAIPTEARWLAGHCLAWNSLAIIEFIRNGITPDLYLYVIYGNICGFCFYCVVHYGKPKSS